MQSAIQFSGVSKSYGLLKALNEINLEVNERERVALQGPNGAGKSTLLKIIAAQIMPTAGEVKVQGLDVIKKSEDVKKVVGYVGHRSFLYDELTIMENLRFYGAFSYTTDDDYNRVLDVTDMRRWRDVKVSRLSHGLRKRGDISRALLWRPKILALDELFSGLDVQTSELLIEFFESHTEQTLMVSSHSSELLEKLCDRVVTLSGGRVQEDRMYND